MKGKGVLGSIFLVNQGFGVNFFGQPGFLFGDFELQALFCRRRGGGKKCGRSWRKRAHQWLAWFELASGCSQKMVRSEFLSVLDGWLFMEDPMVVLMVVCWVWVTLWWLFGCRRNGNKEGLGLLLI